MSERQLNRTQNQHTEAVNPGTEPTGDATLSDLRATADRLLGIADKAFEQIRTEDSEAHIRRHRQRGGQ